MELVIGIIILILIYLLITKIIIPIVIPVAAVALRLFFLGSALVAFILSLKSFLSALKRNSNPYASYIDTHKNAYPGAKRNYCFGPGIHQVKAVIRDSKTNVLGYVDRIKEWRDSKLKINRVYNFWIQFACITLIVMTVVMCGMWMLFFSLAFTSVIVVGLLLFFIAFAVLIAVDRCALAIKSIHSRCAYCKRVSVIPTFLCPECGEAHEKLVPGPYGVLKQTCSCGKKLSTTFWGGRSKYEALCPHCGSVLFSSSAKQCGYQLVGGIGNGKSAYVAAFFHEYIDWLNQAGIEYALYPEKEFRIIDKWFRSGKTDATNEMNAIMYTVIHTAKHRTPVQMSIYDIAGEVFEDGFPQFQQKQLQYCEGFLIALDISEKRSDYEFISTFASELKAVKGMLTNKKIEEPVAVLITKADLFKKEIGLPKIKAEYKAASSAADEGYVQFQSRICRAFLSKRGYNHVVNMLESDFLNVCFFPVSAMGHSDCEEEFEPWGVLQPFFWLVDSEKCPLYEIINSTKEEK